MRASFTKTAQAALKRLVRPGMLLRPDQRGGFCVALGADARRRPIARVSAAEAKTMIAEGLLETDAGDADLWRISLAGRSYLQRLEAAGATQMQNVMDVADFTPISPALRRFRALAAADGSGWFSAVELRAAECFERDCRLSLLSARVTADWSASPIDRGRRASPGGLFGPESATDARARQAQVRAFCGAAGFALLTDVFSEELGFEEIERRRAWPARSAKVGLKMTLSALAGAYAHMRSGARTA